MQNKKINFDILYLNQIQIDALSVWGKFQPPLAVDLFPKKRVSWDMKHEQKTIKLWLGGKTIELIDDGNYMDTESPFHYLSSKASSYYLGGYIYFLLDEINKSPNDINCPYSFGYIHLMSYLSSDKFQIDGQYFLKNQIIIINRFMKIMQYIRIRNGEKFDSDDVTFFKALKNVNELAT
jgi:hypothetical protein